MLPILSEGEMVEKFARLRDLGGLSTNAQMVTWVREQRDVHNRVLTDGAKLRFEMIYQAGYDQEQAREPTHALQAAE